MLIRSQRVSINHSIILSTSIPYKLVSHCGICLKNMLEAKMSQNSLQQWNSSKCVVKTGHFFGTVIFISWKQSVVNITSLKIGSSCILLPTPKLYIQHVKVIGFFRYSWAHHYFSHILRSTESSLSCENACSFQTPSIKHLISSPQFGDTCITSRWEVVVSSFCTYVHM